MVYPVGFPWHLFAQNLVNLTLGSYIYYYAIVGSNFGQFNITLDGVTDTGTAYNATEQSPQLLWSSPTQGNQEHIVVLTNADGNLTSLDHFM